MLNLEEDFIDSITYKELALFDPDEAGRTIQSIKINGVKTTLQEFKKLKEGL